MAKEILIADPDKDGQAEFQTIFETTDYHLVFSVSGEDALLRIKLFKPDLIIAGNDLRDQSGLELCETVKAEPEYAHIPFILFSSMFDEFTEQERKHAKVDGVISKPLQEDAVLNMVEQLMEGEPSGKKVGELPEREREWKSFADMRKQPPGPKEEFLLEELGEGEEEIIELLDVVEEPEQRMSINDFIPPAKEGPIGEIPPLDSWEGIEEEPKIRKEDFILTPDDKETELERLNLELEEKTAPKEPPPEEELFQRIELEEILEKVEQMRPSIEKEWPTEREEVLPHEGLPEKEEAEDRERGIEKFETALQKEIKGEAEAEPLDEELELFPFEELKVEGPDEEEALPAEEEPLDELSEEEFPEELLMEVLGEEEVSSIEEPEAVSPEELTLEEVIPEELAPEEVTPEEITPEEITIREIKPEEIFHEEVRVDRVEEMETPKAFIKRDVSLARSMDLQMEEIIAKGVREMMEEVVTKLVPEMTQHMVGLTLERIEKMVSEIVPDLAEKAIQEEIKRLQKGEKE